MFQSRILSQQGSESAIHMVWVKWINQKTVVSVSTYGPVVETNQLCPTRGRCQTVMEPPVTMTRCDIGGAHLVWTTMGGIGTFEAAS